MKKKLFLLASVAMGVALVGGTFASWAVTDNADPFSIKVSTGEVTTDQTEYVTLEWGENQSMSHVSNLALNTVRKAGVLDLRANTVSTTSPNGTLSYTVIPSNAAHLVEKLEINIYEGDLAATDGVISPETLAGKTPLVFTEGSKVITVTKNAANLFTVAVNLASSTTAADLDDMNGEQAAIRFDWGPGTDVATTTTLYATGFAGVPNIYAWTGSVQNAAFPGVAMTEVVKGSGVYSAEIPATMQNVIFSYDDDYGDETNRQQSGDIVVATSMATNNMFTFDSTVETVHGTFSVYDPSAIKVPTYYVVGDFTEPTWKALEANKMTLVETKEDEYELTLTLAAGKKFKVFESLQNLYFGDDTTWEDCGFTLDEDKNIVVTAAGTYRIHFDLTPGGAGNYIDISEVI